jgi:transcriptional regulator with XRE-family HTH domain
VTERKPDERQLFEEELLVGSTVETLGALLESIGISQRELARRLSVSESRVSQILDGRNLTLRSLAHLGWALGLRFSLVPIAITDRSTGPAANDVSTPLWMDRQRHVISGGETG